MNNPLVSIIIPTYNRASLIGETLDSILAQTYTNWECIIVDDGSSDHTDEVVLAYVKKDKRFQYHKRPDTHKEGGNGARNYGFELSKGEYINWFDSDDLMFENFIESKLECFGNEINIVVNIGIDNAVRKDDLKQNTICKSDNLFKDYLMWKFSILTPSPMFKKSFLLGKDLFNLDIKRGQETELFSRLFYKIHSNAYKIIDVPQVFYRQHIGSISYKDKSYNAEYKKSQLFVFIQNLELCIDLHDKQLIRHTHNLIVNVFFEFLRNREKESAVNLVNKMFRVLKTTDNSKALKFLIFGHFLIFTKSESVFIKRYLKR